MTIYEKLFSLKGKTVVLTGAGGAIAGAMAETIAQCGAQVALIDLCKESSDRVAEPILSEGLKAISLQGDVLNKDSLKRCCEEVLRTCGRIDCLINCAGGNKKEATTSEDISFFDIPLENHRRVFDLNFLGTLLPCQVFGQEIAKQQTGSIVNIASIAGFRPLTRAPAYAAAKAAVINLTQWLAVHMCRHYSAGIRVNAIAPGFCATTQNKYLLYRENGQLTERSKTILGHVPQNRFGDPAELASAAVWLLSDSASFTTGTTVVIDGGFDAFSGV